MKIGSKVSDKAWGDVDKGALGKTLADGYADGSVTKAQIREVYAFVPEEAFGKGSDGKPAFAYSKGWGPHHEVSGGTIVLNRGGLGGAAAAVAGGRSEPSLSGGELKKAKAHLRRHYKAIKEKPPAGLAESLAIRKAGRGKELTELVKGSLDYTMDMIRSAFRAQFNPMDTYPFPFYAQEIFSDHVIVSEYPSDELAPDEYYMVTYQKSDAGYVFAARDEWEIVELTYQPKTATPADVGESGKGRRGKRFDERITACGVVTLLEAEEGKPRRIKAVGVTADVVNGNSRRYPADVLRAAVEELKGHLHESAGQGRFVPVLGEAEHPADKTTRRPNLLETVVKWEAVDFDGAHVLLEGAILPTSKGRDIQALMESGVMPGVSQRGYGESRIEKEDGKRIEVVESLTITGYDLVMEPSDPDATVTMFESQQEEDEMDPEEIRKFIAANPQLFEGMVKGKVDEAVKAMSGEQLKALEERIRSTLSLAEGEDWMKALQEATKAKAELEARKQKETMDAAVAEATKELPYGKLNAAFVEAVKAQTFKSVEEVKKFCEAKRQEYDVIVSQARLAGMGLQVKGPVIETQTGTPEFARGAWEFYESLIKSGHVQRHDLREPKSINEIKTAEMLERFDKLYQQKLMQEAETTSDVSLPYSVSRAILQAVWPELVATSIFDTGVTDQAPSRVYYETYAGESGSYATITDEHVATTADTWVAMAHAIVRPGGLVIQDVGGTVTYTEGTDYVADYLTGKIKALSGGTIADLNSGTVHASYVYDAIRQGENAAIQRGKMQLSYCTLEIAANRLAQQITSEMVLFSRSQIGWDATTRTLAALVTEMRKRIDKALMFNALNAALTVASNSGGTWTVASDPSTTLYGYIGAAKVKCANRYYPPTALLCSLTNSDRIGNSDIFTAAGKRPDADLNANGYVGRLKGLPVFESTEFSDSYIMVFNREIVMYRIFQPMTLKGPYPSYSSTNLVAADQWYAEQYDGAVTPVNEKASYVKVA